MKHTENTEKKMKEVEIDKEIELSIDFKELWILIKKGRLFIISTGFLFALIAAIIVFIKPNEYTSIVSVMPELEGPSTGKLGKFAGLASLAGIDLSNISTSEAVRPDLYPSVINNTSFYLYLLNQKVKVSDGTSVVFRDFYYRAYDIEEDSLLRNKKGLLTSLKEVLGIEVKPFDIKKLSNEQLVHLSEEDGELIEDLTEKIVADMDKKTGIISISVELPDALVAADIARISMEYLTSFVTNYRTEKARVDLNFLAQQLSDAKGKFYNVQSKKAQYSDQFQMSTIRLQSADIARERIESDYRVSSTFYTQLLQQYETAKMKVQEQTPVFKILQKPLIPYEKSGPKRIVFSLLALIMGLFTGILFIVAREFKKIVSFK